MVQKGYIIDAKEQRLIGFVAGPNTPITASDTILSALQAAQGQINSLSSGGPYMPLAGTVLSANFNVLADGNTFNVYGDSSPLSEPYSRMSVGGSFATLGWSLNAFSAYNFTAAATGLVMGYTDSDPSESTIRISNSAMIVTDSQSSKGLYYAADYSSGSTDRWLVDKAYVTTVLGSYLPFVGGTMLGGINMNTNSITNAYTVGFGVDFVVGSGADFKAINNGSTFTIGDVGGAGTGTLIFDTNITSTYFTGNNIGIKNSGGFIGSFKATNLTANRTAEIPNGNCTLVGDTLSQTLTNKTLISPIINVGSDATGDIYYRNSGGSFTRLPVGADGEVLTLVSGIPSWTAPSGGSVAIPIYFSLTGQANSTIGMLAKASGDVTTNPSGKPTTNPYTSHVNGGSDPYPIETGGSITNVTLAISSCAVAQGTVGANPTLRLDVYKEAVGGRVLVGSIDVPIPAAKVAVSNTLGADNYVVVSYDLSSPLAVGGEGIGMQFTNRSGTNEEINAISRLTVTAKIQY